MISSLLPELPGVRPLTRNEIKKDIGLIESYYDSDDSDVSVSSSEAITSSYPVKPRNFAKLPKRDDLLLQSRVIPHSHIDVGAGMSMEDAMEFMKAVETARSDVYEGERERENLEIRYQAMREMCLSQSDSFLAKKKEEKNFIRAVQGLCRNHCQYYDVLSQKNSMLYDMITALQHKKADLTFFGNCRNALEEQAAGADQSHKQKPVSHDQKTSSSSPHFHFYKHQCVSTPYGKGTILNIDVKGEKVALQLPYALMYSTFASVILWASHGTTTGTGTNTNTAASSSSSSSTTTDPLDVNHSHNLRQRWTQALATPSLAVGMSDKRSAEVLLLLHRDKHPTPAPAAAAATSVSSAQQQKAGAVAEEEEKKREKEKEEETRKAPSRAASAKSRRSSSRTKEAVVAKPSSPPPPPSINTSSTTSTSTIPVIDVPTTTNQATREAEMLARIETSKTSIYLNQTKKLPLLFCPPGIAPYLATTYSANYVTESSQAKTTVCPETHMLPHETETSINMNTTKNFLKAEYCLKAFQRSEPVEFFCCEEVDGGGRGDEGGDSDSDSLEEENDSVDQNLPACRFNDYATQVVGFKENLRPLLQKIKECRKRKLMLAHQVESTKMNTAQISQQISKIRLSMFTRRVLYRQNLISNAEREKIQAMEETEKDPKKEDGEKEEKEEEAKKEPEREKRSGRNSRGSKEPPPTTTAVSEKAKESSPEETLEVDNNTDTDNNNNHNTDTDTVSDPFPDIPIDTQPSARRKSTRAAVVATTASSQLLSSSRSKRKKDEVSKEEEAAAPLPPAPSSSSPPVSVPAAAATSTNTTTTAKAAKSANSQRSSSSSSSSSSTTTSTTLKRNPKRSRR